MVSGLDNPFFVKIPPSFHVTEHGRFMLNKLNNSKDDHLKAVESVIEDAWQALKETQHEDGHWAFKLEADATIPAEYILLNHFIGEVEEDIEAKLANYIRSIQCDDGGWPLFHAGDMDVSCSVKAYYALKIVGDDINAPHMKKTRAAILAHGGAAKSNVFTRISLCLFGEIPWRAVPVMPVEIMLLPTWSPFHLSKVSYWSRTVIVPLLVLMALKPKAVNPNNVSVRELFVTPPEEHRRYITNPTGGVWGEVFLAIDKVLHVIEPFFPKAFHKRAIDAATQWFTERLNGEDGLGAIFPAMTNAVMAYHALGYPKGHPDFAVAKKAIHKLLYLEEDQGFCRPCTSPVWDTGLAAQALMVAGEPHNGPCIRKAMDWLVDRQILDAKGDWASDRPSLRPGGWAFQYWNDYYPDVDDTAVVVMALDRSGRHHYQPAITRATEWTIGMQNQNGGWGAFDADGTSYYLNHIPFADHGALLDPPTADVSARCVSMLAQLGHKETHPAFSLGLEYLRKIQEDDGSWFGRWGINYIYGTWSVLSAFNAAGEDMDTPHIRKAVDWLKSRQRNDGGWGEDGATYWLERKEEVKESTPSQTAWAVLGLMAAGEVRSNTVRHGIDYLLASPRSGARWDENLFTAVGFPRVFYLRYHGYAKYFPLWALSRYRNLLRGNAKTVPYGM